MGGELSVRLGGRTFTAPLGPAEESARFVVPATGEVTVNVDPSVSVGSGRVCVVVTPLDTEGEPDRTYFLRGESGLAPRTFHLPAGRYRLFLERRRLGGTASRRVQRLGDPREVDVAAGEFLSLLLP